MLSLARFVYYAICSLYPSPQLPQPLLPVPAFVTIMAAWGSSPFPPSFHLFPSASILPQLARRLHSTPRYFAELVRTWALHSAAQAHDVLHHAKPQRKTAPSLVPSSLQQIAASSHCSKAAPFLRYHMGSAMATEQYLARGRGDLYTVRASTQAPP